MNGKLTRVFLVSVCLCYASMTNAKQVPQLSKDQRTLLQAVVTAVDAAAAQPATSDLAWPMHVMRASDGSHYVAFSVEPPASMPLPPGPVLLYIRLASSSAGSATGALTERSAIRDWLAGTVAAPPVPKRGIVMGEMPAMGATGNLERRNPNSPGSIDMQLMAVERARVRDQQDKREQQRRAELEGQAATPRDYLPFEDFDLSSRQLRPGGARTIERALTAGPGFYTLSVAWADPAAPNPARTVRVLSRSVILPPASTAGLSLSSVIVADAVQVRAAPYTATEQASHPYSIGLTEIAPAADTVFTSDESLAVAFQVINAKASDTGKPDLEVGFRVVRLAGGREEPVASLTPQIYNDATMPAAFDLRAGHAVLAAVSASLATLDRGSYRLKIVVNDKNARQSAETETEFTIAATAKSLLREAPAFAPAFRRESLIEPEMRSYLVRSLRPPVPSPALARALDHAAAGRFVELLAEEPVPDAEQGVRLALTGLARLAVGDASPAIQFQRAQLLGAAIAPARFLAGAARAMEGRDADAIAAWEEASTAGVPKSVIAPFLLDAYLRRNDFKRANALVDGTASAPSTSQWLRAAAGARIATGNYPAALTALDRLLAEKPDDAEALWLWLHAAYGQTVSSTAPDLGARERFIARGQAYVDGNGANANLVRDWLAAVRK